VALDCVVSQRTRTRTRLSSLERQWRLMECLVAAACMHGCGSHTHRLANQVMSLGRADNS